jgi:prevent-host-death family protein
MLKMSTVEARENFSEMINQAAYGNQRVVLTRRGKPLVAVVSLQELGGVEANNVAFVETETEV